jgi:hypothetical protein
MAGNHYEAEVVSGNIEHQRRRVFEYVKSRGTATGTETDLALGLRGGHVRLGELVKMGALETCDDRACSVTGRVVTCYRASGRPYISKAQRKSRETVEEYLERERVEGLALRDTENTKA